MILEKIKSKLWFTSIPVAIAALLSMSAIKDIEDAHVELDNGKRTAYYLRCSTDSLTYLAIAYTATGKEKFINEFNSHLERRKLLTFNIDPEGLVYYNEGLRLSNELASVIEAPAFAAMNDTAFFTDQYLSYKTRIITSIEQLRDVTYKNSNNKLQRAVLELNIYIYFLVLLLLGFVVLMRFDKQPIIKPVRKKKPIKKTTKKLIKK
jgi:hypothetical protein